MIFFCRYTVLLFRNQHNGAFKYVVAKQEEEGSDAISPDAEDNKKRSLDKISLILFPVLFLIFNIVYWFAYMI